MSAWFESVAMARSEAQRRLPPSVYSAIVAGTERGLTAADNVNAFDELWLSPGVATGVGEVDITTEVLGRTSSMPVMISPTGVQAIHPEAEVAIARASASRGVAMGLSCFASRHVSEVVGHNPAVHYQLYWIGGRERMAEQVEAARVAGAAGLILTLDWSFSHARDWGSPDIPERVDMRAMLKHAPEALRRPRWTFDFLRAGGPPSLSVPNLGRGDGIPTFWEAYGEWIQTPPPDWDDVAWLRRRWDGNFTIKGIMTVDDAHKAADVGASAVSVSNHGGNNIDGTPASIRALPAIARAVGSEIEVLMDGGIRRGSDVVKAVALGAKAVLLGRSALWGLAAAGQSGVENVLDIMRSGVESTLRGLGVANVSGLAADHVMIPASFESPRHRGIDNSDSPGRVATGASSRG